MPKAPVPIGSYGALLCGRSVGVPLVRMHTFQVGKHYLAVEDVPMLTASVFDHSISDSILIFPSELGSATRTLLSDVHSGQVYEANGSRPVRDQPHFAPFADAGAGCPGTSRISTYTTWPSGKTFTHFVGSCSGL